MLLPALDSSIAAFGGSGIPVFGVQALKPTNRVPDGDSFRIRHTGYTPVPVGDTKNEVL